jgi:hypothetical protein
VKLKVKTKREYTQAQSWANEGGGGSSSSSNDPVLEFTKALVLSAGALKPKVTQVDLAEARLRIWVALLACLFLAEI